MLGTLQLQYIYLGPPLSLPRWIPPDLPAKEMKRTTFINKHSDSGNVSRSTPEERRRINERNREYRSLRRSTRARNVPRPRPDEPGQDSVPQTDEIGEQLILAQNLTHGPSSPGSVPSAPGSSIEPFDIAPVPMNTDVARLLRYYKEAYYHCLWSNIEYALESRIKGLVIKRCLPETVIYECMQSRSRMYSLLANTSCHLQHEIDVDSGVNRLQLIQRGTACLRDDLRSNDSRVDHHTLLNAIHLYLAAKSFHQLEAAQAHLAGAKAVLNKLVEQGAPFRAPIAAMTALVDIELSARLLREMPREVLERGDEEESTTRLAATSLEEIQDLPATSRP